MKILINTPSLNLLGGVSNHYMGLKGYWAESVKYNTVGRRRVGNGIIWLPWDVFKFLFRLLFFHPDFIIINPSLKTSALKRDFIFLNVAKCLHFKVAVFMHGFNQDTLQTVSRTWVVKNLNRASMMFVLGNSIKKELLDWGVSIPIHKTTTKVDDKMIEDFNITERRGKINNILFLTRIEKEKGIYEAIDTVALLQEKYDNLRFTIVGDGTELNQAKEYVKKIKVQNVVFCGKLCGENLINAYKKADIYLFPSYTEGMPTSVLEAMAFGLPIITRNVGGVPDFFEDGKMGYITNSLRPTDFANAIIYYIENPDVAKKISLYNAKYAREHFLASHVSSHIELCLISNEIINK